MKKEIIKQQFCGRVADMVATIAVKATCETLQRLADRLEHEYQIRADLLERGRDIWTLSSGTAFQRLYEQRQRVRASAVSYLRAAMLVRSEI